MLLIFMLYLSRSSLPHRIMNERIIGQKIKAIRHIAQLTQAELAAEFGVTQQQISKYEKGLSVPPLSLLMGLSQKYGLTIDWFCEED